MKQIILTPTNNDLIKLEVRGLKKINEIKEYHSIRVNLIGIIVNTKTPFSVDFGVGDVIFPSAVEKLLYY